MGDRTPVKRKSLTRVTSDPTSSEKKKTTPEKELPVICSRSYSAEVVFSHNLLTAQLEDMIIKLVLDRDGGFSSLS